MSTGNICHRTSSSTTKHFHIHKNTNNKDICNTNNKLFMILIIATLQCIVCGFIQDFCLGWGGGASSVLCHTHFLEPTLLFDAHLCIRVYTSH